MGCDGGTIPKRDELVKTAKKPAQQDKDSVRIYKWQHCALSQEKLVRPVVGCELGKLYNKLAIIERLLNKKSGLEAAEGSSNTDDDQLSHIKSLKDVRELDLADNPAFIKWQQKPKVGDGYNDHMVSEWICPVTGLEMNGKFKFVFCWKTGKVLSERALKILKNDKEGSIADDDLIVINPEQSDEEVMLKNMGARKMRKKMEKKTKKRENGKAETEGEAAPVAAKKSKATTSSTSTKDSQSTNSASESKSIQHDSSKSDVYKSIFSSHPSAQKKDKGHWVTFDPRYN